MDPTADDIQALGGWPYLLADDFINAVQSSKSLFSLVKGGFRRSTGYDPHELIKRSGHALVLEESNDLWTRSDTNGAKKMGLLHPRHWKKIKAVHLIMPREDQTYFSWNFDKVVHYSVRLEHVITFMNAVKTIGLQLNLYTNDR